MENLLPTIFATDTTVFKLVQSYSIRSVGNDQLQMVYRYDCGDEYITVYADASAPLGSRTLTAYLPGIDIINAHPDATVHLCLCPDVLWTYLDLARDGKLAERANVVVTGCFGGVADFDALDLSPLLFHRVVLICSPDRAEYSGIEKMANRCLDNGATSVEIFSTPLKA